MARKTTPRHLGTVSAKVPSSMIAQLDQIARNRCCSRSFLLRELVEGAVEGRLELEEPAQRVRRRVRASLSRDTEALRGAMARDVAAGPSKPPQAVAPADPDVGGAARNAAGAA